MSLRHVPVDTAVVRVAGEDAAAFLQGQCTADLRGVALADALWLNRKGRVLAHTVVAAEADGSFLLLCPHLPAAELRSYRHLAEFTPFPSLPQFRL